MPGNDVLLVAGLPPEPDDVAAARAEHPGARVGLVTLGQRDADDPVLHGLEPSLVHALGPSARAHGPAVRRLLRGAARPARLRLHLEHDPWVTRRREDGVELVALDRPGRRALRRLDQEPLTPDPDPLRRRADELGATVNQALAVGELPPELAAYLDAELAVADQHLARGELRDAAWSTAEALRVALHRVLHLDRSSSPLAADPAGFLAAWRASAVGRRIAEPRRREQTVRAPSRLGRLLPRRRAVAPGTERGRAMRISVLTRKNDNFLPEILAHLEADPGYDVRFRDVLGVPAVEAYGRGAEPLIAEALAATDPSDPDGLEHSLHRDLGPMLAERDVVFVEWWGAVAAMVSRLDLGETRVVVRAHSKELVTAWPQLTDLSGVDDIVFVSEHLRDFARSVVPGLDGPDAPRLHVVTLALDLRRCVRPKPSEARHTVGVVGASKVVKDPRWALEVLRHLRRHDPRYRLLLVSGHLDAEQNQATRAYAAALAEDLAELGDAVTVIGHTDDVPGVLEQVGVVLSSSVRESFHVGLVEGAASGAVPVVRDWPYFPGGAARLFPPEWVVPDPEAAAARILALTASEQTWRDAGREASERVIADWDWPVVRAQYDRLLRGR